ncbi:Uncharacterised protein [Mycobacteroides abscessus subsp. abscessus]|uniref:hypothetical protein n=1 Tax=Mycobacteroides abscessus TaxID=36809 RepID=UPI00092BD297|nr:hypothetical protein [Mycobacteroides abscessus]SHZ40104.1 Uncharacterised protein [Mycobacteroides abscessus subsp. abscessus]SHZ41990.1 Uncharacterised protein [Mycobacteroides abscessus subsp. abscessus]
MSSAESATKTPLSVGRKTFLHCVFTTAIEGGIQHWARVHMYHWGNRSGKQVEDDLDGFYAVIRSAEADIDDDENNTGWGIAGLEHEHTLRIDLNVVDRGTSLFARYCRGEINSHGIDVPEEQRKPLADDAYWRQFLAAEATHGQEGDYDALVADNIVQFGLFGKLVYG